MPTSTRPRTTVGAPASTSHRRAMATALAIFARLAPASGGAEMREATQRSPVDRAASSQLWLIEPNAAPDDPAWQGREIWQLVVAAPTAAFARLEAERWAQRQNQVMHAGNESSSMRAGFLDEKLYFARPLSDD